MPRHPMATTKKRFVQKQARGRVLLVVRRKGEVLAHLLIFFLLRLFGHFSSDLKKIFNIMIYKKKPVCPNTKRKIMKVGCTKTPFFLHVFVY